VKIVSLLPSATEIVFALGLGDQLEGVTCECDYPEEAQSKPIVSDTALPRDRLLTAGEVDDLVAGFMARHDPIYILDKPLIQQVQPDLILAQDLCKVCAVPSGQVEQALAELGCTADVLSLDPRTIEDILESILAVGQATDTRTDAEVMVAGLRARIHRVRAWARALPSIHTLCLEWSDPPFVAGHWIPGMVGLAGGDNLLNVAGQPSWQPGWRQIVDAAPEVIVFMPCGFSLEDAESQAEELFDIPDFADTPAARMGNVFAVDASSFFSRPGPRIVDGLEILAWAIHPERFPQPPRDRAVRVER
jgi:iron complex transport system substrate-binding protein